MIQHLFFQQKGWKYSKINAVSSAEMLQMHLKLSIYHYCLESKSGTVFNIYPLPQFLNSSSITIFLMLFPLFNCFFKFYRLRIKNWNAFEFLCVQDLWWGQVSWFRQWSSFPPLLHNVHCGTVRTVNIQASSYTTDSGSLNHTIIFGH